MAPGEILGVPQPPHSCEEGRNPYCDLVAYAMYVHSGQGEQAALASSSFFFCSISQRKTKIKKSRRQISGVDDVGTGQLRDRGDGLDLLLGHAQELGKAQARWRCGSALRDRECRQRAVKRRGFGGKSHGRGS